MHSASDKGDDGTYCNKFDFFLWWSYHVLLKMTHGDDEEKFRVNKIYSLSGITLVVRVVQEQSLTANTMCV